MELSVRDWMIIVGMLLIVAVLFDGYRRVRNERRGNIRMSLNKQFLNSTEADNEKSSELPSGGARPAAEHRKADNDQGNIDAADYSGSKNLRLDQDVPMLMESVHEQTVVQQQPTTSLDHSEVEDTEQVTESIVFDGPSQDSASQKELLNQQTAAEKLLATDIDEKEVVVINVVARDAHFKGPDLLHILLACDVRFGEMDIFHRHEKANGSGAVQFSVANSVEPGAFDLDHIDELTTPGVCFFMSVPGPDHVIEAFDCLVETAQCLVKNLNGELRDESRSVMTAQTLEHCRQRLIEFERRQLTQHA